MRIGSKSFSQRPFNASRMIAPTLCVVTINDGRIKSLAFIKDPDAYWFEIIQPATL